MITDERYAIETIKLLNELKYSLSETQKHNLLNKINNDSFFKTFFKEKALEISRFVKATPKKRLSTKKWQEDFDLYVYGAYCQMLVLVNLHFIPKVNFHPTMSYRKDLSNLALNLLALHKIENLFFQDDAHHRLQLYHQNQDS